MLKNKGIFVLKKWLKIRIFLLSVKKLTLIFDNATILNKRFFIFYKVKRKVGGLNGKAKEGSFSSGQVYG